MVGVPHGTNRLGVGPPTLRIDGPMGAPKWDQIGKIVKSLKLATDCPIWLKFCTMI